MNRYILVALLLCVLVGVASAWGASMGAWDYRKEITLNNTGAELTNYQVMFTVNRSAGSDSGFTVYLNGKCESDYDDIRFTTSDEDTLCDYWIESNSSTVATIWVEVPTIGASGNTTLYLYYGNAAASAVSDGNATFECFVDKDTTDGWTGTNLDISTSGDFLRLHQTGAGSSTHRPISITPTHFIAEYRFKTISEGSNDQAGVMICDNDPTTRFSTTYSPIYSDQNDVKSYYSAAYQTLNSNGYSEGTEYILKIIIDETNSASGVSYYFMDTARNVISQLTGKPFSLGSPTDADYLSIGAHTSSTFGSDYYLRFFFIRPYTATEPTVSAWGSEEAQLPLPKYLTVDFSGVPTSGYVPLTVYFTDATVGYNVTLDTWAWSFGDTSQNSTQQNPAHTYTTSGLYNVILTATNTSFSKTNTTAKIAYINVTVNPDIPVADFTVTETCGETTDTFYFIDYSTGGGLYAWNWSFGDGSYSELRNPTHQYAVNGTYSVNLSVWGAYGFDSLLRSNLITVPCGAPTPTPTPTVTPTGGGNVTEGNVTYIYAPDQDYVPFPIWLALVIITIALFGHSLIFLKNSDLTAILAALFALISAWLSNMIGYIDVQVTSYAEEIVISPLIQAVHPPWLVYTMLIFAFVSVMNIFAAIYKVYLKPVPWNEIYDRKLPKWERRK